MSVTVQTSEGINRSSFWGIGWVDVASAFLAILFGFASIDKLFHYWGFLNALENYAVLPTPLIRYLAPAVVLTELWTSVCLIIRKTRKAASLMGCLLLSIFAIALAFNYYYGIQDACGCWFTITLGKGTLQHVLMNVVWAALCLAVYSGSAKTSQPH
ncbi:MauE/DoxX family redox-associated membrane protein [Edaphobacter dinghuensis]|nr:MauE/DoxX family redox-associated membrane protein [Edaphobacter dinghuensis]